MDAVLFLKEKDRMCKSYGFHECPKCGLSSKNNGKTIGCGGFVEQYPEEAVAIVEKWSNEHHFKTKKDKFFEIFPNAPKVSGRYPTGIPCALGWCNQDTCANCKYVYETRTFCWNLPYEGDD